MISLGIILVLGALLLPAAAQMINKAKDDKCLSNLRQWGVALNCYLTDSQGQLPTDGDDDAPTWTQIKTGETTAWYNILPPYVSQPTLAELASNVSTAVRLQIYSPRGSIFQCPRAKWITSESTDKSGRPYFCYAFNSKIFGTKSSGQSVTRACVYDLVDHGAANVNNRRIGASTVPMLMDTRCSSQETKAVSGMNSEYGKPKCYTAQLSNRHGAAYTNSGKANIVFFDGSVRSFKASELMNSSGKNINTSPVIWDPWDPDAS